MGLADRLSQLTRTARDSAAEHKDQIEQAIDKAAVAADQRTGGQYRDKIAKAEAKSEEYLQNLQPSGRRETTHHSTTRPVTRPAAAGERDREPRPPA